MSLVVKGNLFDDITTVEKSISKLRDICHSYDFLMLIESSIQNLKLLRNKFNKKYYNYYANLSKYT